MALREALSDFGYLVLELMGRGITLSKDEIIEHCDKHDIVDYLLSFANGNMLNIHMPDSEKNILNAKLDDFCETVDIRKFGNRPDQSIYKSEKQGLNALLFVTLSYLSYKEFL